ncbi:uncharacterized protein SPSK_02699 [Sporothrix schenckii 1099-18]|uniref:Uncharacterized protein n=1 Tax=Sporothrix schenckii 1099-18 TaxID=1397361 RepID=A0A0F2MCT2_SPOSC|nr:uncharacterized protein SPSK_02699 [Sporothrix schenckii 1099-18]KJR86655.1 hypothetical protein SPSK_02699 [Sporothrix schenckii 1099-18]
MVEEDEKEGRESLVGGLDLGSWPLKINPRPTTRSALVLFAAGITSPSSARAKVSIKLLVDERENGSQNRQWLAPIRRLRREGRRVTRGAAVALGQDDDDDDDQRLNVELGLQVLLSSVCVPFSRQSRQSPSDAVAVAGGDVRVGGIKRQWALLVFVSTMHVVASSRLSAFVGASFVLVRWLAVWFPASQITKAVQFAMGLKACNGRERKKGSEGLCCGEKGVQWAIVCFGKGLAGCSGGRSSGQVSVAGPTKARKETRKEGMAGGWRKTVDLTIVGSGR